MKKMKTYVLAWLATISSPLLCSIGCLDNSKHLKASYDYKNYHLVACNCPCGKYKLLPDRGKCTQCHHYHDVHPVYVINRKEFYKQVATTKQVLAKNKCTKKKNLFARTFVAYPLED